MLRTHSSILSGGFMLLTSLVGCVSPGYEYLSHDLNSPVPKADVASQADIERGQPNILIDSIGWAVGIPGKILLWDRRVDSHHISPETETAIAEYMERNSLGRTKIRLNQYDPLDEWRRLTENQEVGAGWRYTLGALATATYTILPGRVFGGDHYNPFTNTISLYSDHPAIALHEAGHAKDIRSRRLPGTYAAGYVLPFVALWHEEKATSDVLSYLHDNDRPQQMREAYRILYPAYGTHVAGQFNNFIPPPFDLAVTAACVIPGHIAGRVQASRVEDRLSLAAANPFETATFAESGHSARGAKTAHPSRLKAIINSSSSFEHDLD